MAIYIYNFKTEPCTRSSHLPSTHHKTTTAATITTNTMHVEHNQTKPNARSTRVTAPTRRGIIYTVHTRTHHDGKLNDPEPPECVSPCPTCANGCPVSGSIPGGGGAYAACEWCDAGWDDDAGIWPYDDVCVCAGQLVFPYRLALLLAPSCMNASDCAASCTAAGEWYPFECDDDGQRNVDMLPTPWSFVYCGMGGEGWFYADADNQLPANTH